MNILLPIPLKRLQAETAAKLDALLPALLDCEAEQRRIVAKLEVGAVYSRVECTGPPWTCPAGDQDANFLTNPNTHASYCFRNSALMDEA